MVNICTVCYTVLDQHCAEICEEFIAMFKDTDFRTSKACSTGGVFNCVAVAITPEVIGIRDTKDASKTTLQYSPAEWREFVAAVKRGEFDA